MNRPSTPIRRSPARRGQRRGVVVLHVLVALVLLLLVASLAINWALRRSRQQAGSYGWRSTGRYGGASSLAINAICIRVPGRAFQNLKPVRVMLHAFSRSRR